jgi:hypothetical protein
MILTPAEQLAKHWLEMTLTPEAECSDELFDAGFSLNILVDDDPELAWDVILNIVGQLDEKRMASGEDETRRLASNLAAGPLESLLAKHGETFIERLEHQAKKDSRFSWVLAGVWQNDMPDRVWNIVRRLAGKKTL